MDTLTPEQLITNPCSHNGDVVDAGGRNGYPSDSLAALNKLHVELSGDSDQADEELASVTSGPVSAHTPGRSVVELVVGVVIVAELWTCSGRRFDTALRFTYFTAFRASREKRATRAFNARVP